MIELIMVSSKLLEGGREMSSLAGFVAFQKEWFKKNQKKAY